MDVSAVTFTAGSAQCGADVNQWSHSCSGVAESATVSRCRLPARCASYSGTRRNERPHTSQVRRVDSWFFMGLTTKRLLANDVDVDARRRKTMCCSSIAADSYERVLTSEVFGQFALKARRQTVPSLGV